MVFSGSQEGFFWGVGGVRICYDVLFHTTSWFHARGDIYHPFPAFLTEVEGIHGIKDARGMYWEGGTNPSYKP